MRLATIQPEPGAAIQLGPRREFTVMNGRQAETWNVKTKHNFYDVTDLEIRMDLNFCTYLCIRSADFLFFILLRFAKNHEILIPTPYPLLRVSYREKWVA